MSDIQKQLDENIPDSVVSTRSGGGNKQLSYLETWYVIDRMNQVFGSLSWSQEITEITLLTGTEKPAYRAVVRLIITHKGATAIKEGVGYGSDKSGLNPHEMAMKEAVSDAFKTAAKNLGRSMGLALYDKTQQYVGEPDVKPDAPKQPAARQATPETKQAANAGPAIPATKSKVNPAVFKQQIRSAFAILKDQKRITTDEFVKDYTQGVKVEDLDETAARVIILKLNTNFPGII